MLKLQLFIFIILCLAPSFSSATEFPKLFGMNIGKKHYHDPVYLDSLAKLDAVILGFYPGWKRTVNGSRFDQSSVCDYLKSRNPDMYIGQYTILNETYDVTPNKASNDKAYKIRKHNWWLKDAFNRKLQWSSKYDAYDINLTTFAKPDDNGDRYSEWLAKREYELFFKSNDFNVIYCDNVFEKCRVKSADWKYEAINTASNLPEIVKEYQYGHIREWNVFRKLMPESLIIGNTTFVNIARTHYKGMLNGAFIEGIMGKSWSIEKRKGWLAMMDLYISSFPNLLHPKIVVFNQHGDPSNYKEFRYGFASCLLGDGYYNFTSKNDGYSSVPWFDEYEINLGVPLEPMILPSDNGIYSRKFSNGLVLVNSSRISKTINLPQTYCTINGKQDPSTNNGICQDSYTLEPRDGLILLEKH